MKTFVIAGTYQEAKSWIAKNYQERVAMGDQQASTADYKYVSHADDIKGYTNPHGVFIGNWLGRPDIFEIVEALMMRSTHVNTTLGKIWEQVKPKVKPTPKQPPLQKVAGGYTLAVQDAANLLAKEIDAEVMRTIHQKINGGVI